jgi:hypothetical protein
MNGCYACGKRAGFWSGPVFIPHYRRTVALCWRLDILPLSSRLRIILTLAQSETKIDFLLDGLPSFTPNPPEGWRD